MTTEENKVTDERYVREVLNGNNLAAIDEIMAPNYVSHIVGFPPSDREGDKQFIGMLRVAFPDLEYVVDAQFAEGNQVLHRMTTHGTHQREFMGIPPTFKKVVVQVVNINTFENGRVVEAWSMLDQLGLLQQLGAIPAPQVTAGQVTAADAQSAARGY
jgi:predicted ester cyclase